MDKLLQDIEKHCNMLSAEREEMYRRSCEALLSAKIPLVLTQTMETVGTAMNWTEQEVEEWEIDLIRLRGDALNTYHDMNMEYLEPGTTDVVELMAMLDKELIKYNNMI